MKNEKNEYFYCFCPCAELFGASNGLARLREIVVARAPTP